MIECLREAHAVEGLLLCAVHYVRRSYANHFVKSRRHIVNMGKLRA
jgi:hypothetical protein